MFFEPPEAQEESTRSPEPELPGWYAPPAEEMGALIVSETVLARSSTTVAILRTIQAFSTGCLMNVDIVMKPHALPSDDYQSLYVSVFTHMVAKVSDGRLSDKLLRFGVRFADGVKATTVGQRFGRTELQQDPPAVPRLSLLPGGPAMRSGDEDAGAISMGLWLWPSPPPEPFDFAVEWPAGGIELSFVQLDGAAIVSAAQRSSLYWPD